MNTVAVNDHAAAAPGAAPQDLEKLAALAREQARNVMKKIPLLGPVAWLMMAGAGTRHTFVSELEWRVLPALALQQAKLYFREEAPVAFASWARLSDTAAARYQRAPHQLAPEDWRSGSQVWLVDVLAPFGNGQEVLKDLRANVLKGEVLHQMVPTDQDVQVLTWPAC